jgi:hypothetical protein
MNFEHTTLSPVRYGVGIAHFIGSQAGRFLCYAGQPKAEDNSFELFRAHLTDSLDTAIVGLSYERPSIARRSSAIRRQEAADNIALGELLAVRRFMEIHGAHTPAEAEAEDMEPTAPPEPLAIKQIERLLDEYQATG